MFLVKKMHGKQITVSLDLPTMSQQGSRLDTWRVKLLHSLDLNVKRTVEMVQIRFLTPLCCSFCCLSSLASHISSTGPSHLTLPPWVGNTSRVSANCSGHQVGCGKLQPFLLPEKNILRELLTPLVAVAVKMSGTTRQEQPESYCRFLQPQLFSKASSGVYPTCLDPPQGQHAWKLCCRALIWPEGMSHLLLSSWMCRAPSSVGCHAAQPGSWQNLC